MLLSRTIITGTGSFLAPEIKTNDDFALCDFYGEDHQYLPTPTEVVVEKFKQITGIEERRYANTDMTASDLGALAGALALEDAGVDPESIDQIIVAHNFGDVRQHTHQPDTIPSLASRIKKTLAIHNPSCVAYDIIFGCAGWLQGVIHAHSFFKAGIASKCLVIGTETLSRIVDLYDRDSMIFSDGAGAFVLEKLPGENNSSGIIDAAVQSHCVNEAYYIWMEPSYFPGSDPNVRYMKMKGSKVYEYAIKNVPAAMKICMEKSGVDIGDLKKIFIHQANEKMDAAIVRNFYRLYGISNIPEKIMPMNIRELGNCSVATIPTLFDMVLKGNLPGHDLSKGDVIMFAAVGAGMNINAACYRM